MKIYPPLKNVALWGWWPVKLESVDHLKKIIARSGQFFGQDLSGKACKYDKSFPCDKTLYQHLGLTAHNGLDIPCKRGEPILAAHDGIAIEVQDEASAGLGVTLWDPNQKIKTVYWHNKINKVKTGQGVRAGDVIALADSTGLSSGDHLHFGLKLADDSGRTINIDNSYNGAIDPLPHMVWFEPLEDMRLTRDQVRKFYVLSRKDYNSAALDHWQGKELNELLEEMIKHDIARLQEEVVKKND